MAGYGEKLKDPRWQQKRLRVFERDGWACTLCGDKDTTLHVHHLYYEGAPWDVPDYALRTLCAPCHEIVTIDDRDVIHDIRVSLARRGLSLNELWSLCACLDFTRQGEYSSIGQQSLAKAWEAFRGALGAGDGREG